MEKISVVIPAFNAEETIEKAVASVLAQKQPDRRACGPDSPPEKAEGGRPGDFDLEILLVDDGSTDGTPALCDALALKHPEAKVIHQKNAGVSAARNAGIRAASGKWLMTLDDDDYIGPGMFSAMLSAAEKESADLVICGIRLVRPETQREAASAAEKDGPEREGKEETDGTGAGTGIYEEEPLAAGRDEFLRQRMLSLYDRHLLTTHSNKLYDLDRIRRENIYYDEELQINEDSDFVFRYLRHAGRIVQVRGAYLSYVQHGAGQSLITTFRKNGVSSALKLSRDLEELFREMRGSTAGAEETAGTGEAAGTAEETVAAKDRSVPEQSGLQALREGMDRRMLVHILSCAGQMYYRSELTDGEKLAELAGLTEDADFRRLLARTKAGDLKTAAAKFLLAAGLVPVYHLLCKVLYRHCR